MRFQLGMISLSVGNRRYGVPGGKMAHHDRIGSKFVLRSKRWNAS